MAELSTKKSEVQQIIRVLNDDTFATDEDMAKAVLKQAFNLLRQRSTWVVAHYIGESNRPTFWGMESTENAARKFAATLGGGKALLVQVNPAAGLEQTLDDLAVEEEQYKGPCTSCGHDEWQHLKHSYNGKPTASAKVNFPCAAKCKCTKYVGEQ